MMRSESLFLPVIVGILCYTGTATLAQDTGPYDQEMRRWRVEQEKHLERLLEITFEQQRGIAIPDALLMNNRERALDVLEEYQESPSHSVRLDAYALARRIGVSAHDPTIRQRVVGQLTKGCFDPESGQVEGRWLLKFSEQDFSPEARDMLRELVVKKPIRGHVILVLGVAGMTEMDSWLKTISDKHFSAVLALARLGDDDAARRAVEHVDKIQNMSVRVAQGLDKLGYTHHPIALEYIAGYLDSSEGEVKGTDYYAPPYKNTALRVIAAHFPDCPVKREEWTSRYSQDEFAKVRQWLLQRRAQADK